MKNLVVLLVLLFGHAKGDLGGKKVLVIGIDGTTVAGLENADTPVLDMLRDEGSWTFNAHAGGEVGTISQQATSSGPGWTSILTGVWKDKHGVSDNSFEGYNWEEYPHIFKRIKEQAPNAYLSSISQWHPINDQILSKAEGSWDYMLNAPGNGDAVAASAIEHITSKDPDFLFLHFDDVDHAGHTHGYETDEVHSPKYIKTIENIDENIGQVLDTIFNKPNYELEDWLFIRK